MSVIPSVKGFSKPHETFLCCFVFHGMNEDHCTNWYSFWEQCQPVPQINFLLFFLTLIAENKTLPKQASKLQVYFYHSKPSKAIFLWRLIKKLRSREHYLDKFIEVGKEDTCFRNTDHPPHQKNNNQINKKPNKFLKT